MRKVSKALALLLAMLMIVTSMPMSVFAAAEGNPVFSLIVDDNATDDPVVSGGDGQAPSGEDLYDDGVLVGNLLLDWDDYFDKNDQNGRDVGYKLWRNQGEMVSAGDVEGEFDEENWTQISMFSGGKVNVLVVYPNGAQGIMKKWLTTDIGGQGPAGKNLFNIEEIALADFNTNPALTVKSGDNAGDPYDVVLFGTLDGNGGSEAGDLSNSALTAVQTYLASGGAVLFGHDTLTTHGMAYHPNFNKFADDLGIVLLDTGKLKQAGLLSEKTTNAKVVKQGTLTSYPWEITGDLVVPETHALFQVTADSITKNGTAIKPATVWMELADGSGSSEGNKDGIYGIKDTSKLSGWLLSGYSVTNPQSNAYLMTNGNMAMIQTGHSTGQGGASDDERKVFANTLFYLMEKPLDSYAADIDFADEADPVVKGLNTSDTDVAAVAEDIKENISISGVTANGDHQIYSATLSWTGIDVGTPYKYYVEALSDGKVIDESNEIEAVALATLKGYKVVLMDGEGNEVEDLGLVESADGETYEYTTPNTLKTETDYELHITPVDLAGNEGEEVIVVFNQPLTDPEVETEIEAVIPENDTIPEDSRVEEIPSEDGSGTEKVTYYYPGNYLDKDDNEFDERQEDKEIVLDITASVEHSEREIIGTLVIVDKDGNEVKRIEEIGATPSYGYPLKEQLSVTIEDIYDEDDYGEDGEFTATITWNDKATGEQVAEDECKIIIKRPDYKVEFTYKDVDKDGKVVEKTTEPQYVKHGDNATAPSTKLSVNDGNKTYVNKGWDKDYTNVTSDLKVNAKYNTLSDSRPTQPQLPTQPTQPSKPKDDIDFIRLGGETRIETAIEISKEGWKDGAKVVILATANQFPDAMAGVPLAKAVDAPILLTVNGEKLEEIVKAEIARLSPEKVYILGQTDAVNANIEKELDALYEIERVGGKDRFGTAAQIAYEMEEVYGEKADAVYFVRSDLFPDALSVSSVAAIEHNPILYVAPDGKLCYETIKYANSIGTKATIIGGPEAVNAVGEENVKTLFKSVDRIYGDDRYDTSVEVCTAKNALFTGKATALATGKKFPDALTGGAFAAKYQIPVLLVNGSVSTGLADYLSNRPIDTLYVFGGQLAVSDQVAYQALGYCVSYTE